MEKYKDLPMDLADGTLATVAEYNNTTEVFTLDHRDFRVYRTSQGKRFRLLPPRL